MCARARAYAQYGPRAAMQSETKNGSAIQSPISTVVYWVPAALVQRKERPITMENGNVFFMKWLFLKIVRILDECGKCYRISEK